MAFFQLLLWSWASTDHGPQQMLHYGQSMRPAVATSPCVWCTSSTRSTWPPPNQIVANSLLPCGVVRRAAVRGGHWRSGQDRNGDPVREAAGHAGPGVAVGGDGWCRLTRNRFGQSRPGRMHRADRTWKSFVASVVLRGGRWLVSFWSMITRWFAVG